MIEAMPIDQSPWSGRHTPEDLANFIRYARNMGKKVADLLASNDSKAADSFITGAQQAMESFSVGSKVSAALSDTTLRFHDHKEGKVQTTFIVIDATRLEAQKQALAILQKCAFTELKRHPNKKRTVTFLMDEATNFRVYGLIQTLTWGRSFGVKLHICCQSLSAFKETYGENALNVLLSETEIKQFLSGQREPETLALIKGLLGEESVIDEGHQGQGVLDVSGVNYVEQGKPLMTEEEIRRTDKTILFVRQHHPMLVDLPPYAAISPWRRQVAENPYHPGKRWLLPIRLRLKRRKP